MEELLYCYNKGCGKKFRSSENVENSCSFHPGHPVFHDALKGWSCCKKRSTDFTEFLNIPGCTTGYHSNEKPVVETAPPQKVAEFPEVKELVLKPLQPIERPSQKEALITLKLDVVDSYKLALEKMNSELQVQSTNDTSDSGITEGTSCKNNGCRAVYVNESTNEETCLYHSGIPVFHEGMKFWSCCQQKTTDFTSFLGQIGCASGRHVWTKKEVENKVTCRYDWHQTASFVTVTIFSKFASPTETIIKSNKVFCDICIVFDHCKNVFKKEIVLRGAIDPSKSHVKIMTSKVEINLKKLEPGSWSSLEL